MNSSDEIAPEPAPPPLPHQVRRIRFASRFGLIVGTAQAALTAVLCLIVFTVDLQFNFGAFILFVVSLVQAISAYRLSEERFGAFMPFVLSSVFLGVFYLVTIGAIIFTIPNLVPVVLLFLSRGKSSSAPTLPIPSNPERAPQSKDEDLY